MPVIQRPDYLPPVLQDVLGAPGAPAPAAPAVPAGPAWSPTGPVVGEALPATRAEAQARTRARYKARFLAERAPGYVAPSGEDALARSRAQQLADLQATADRDGWPDWIRVQYGLAPKTPAAALAPVPGPAPAPAATAYPLLSSLVNG
jgi:hypothetical protein